jgi:hypothetical protein
MADTVKFDSFVTASALPTLCPVDPLLEPKECRETARRLTPGSAKPMRINLTRRRIGGREFPRAVQVVLAPTRVGCRQVTLWM